MAQRKAKLISTTIKTREDLEAKMARFSEIENRVDAINAGLNDKITALRAAVHDEVAQLEEECDAIVEDLANWAALNPDEFAKKKSLELVHGVIGYRTGTPAVRLKRGKPAEDIIAELKATSGCEPLVRKKEEIDKPAVLARWGTDADGIDWEKTLTRIGITVSQSETFFAAPKKEDVAQS